MNKKEFEELKNKDWICKKCGTPESVKPFITNCTNCGSSTTIPKEYFI